MRLCPGITRGYIRVVAIVLLYAVMAQNMNAQTHVVSPAELHSAVEQRSHQREQNLESVKRFLAGPHGDEVRKSSKLTSEQVTAAVASLNDEELEALNAKVKHAEQQFAANDFVGGRSTVAWIIVLIGLAFLALIFYGLYGLTHP
ncbi:MAG TPA: hypothetical protein VLA83_11375 [Candidatus Binatia bacterium]|nr:hypothetical protein [Candidatus Binatia bacterium]